MNLKKKSGMILERAGIASSHFYKHLLNGGCWVISVIDNSLLRKKLKQIYSDGSCYPCHCISEGKTYTYVYNGIPKSDRYQYFPFSYELNCWGG